MNNSKRYYDVLAKIRKFSHNRDKHYINREQDQKRLYEVCQKYLILDPASDTQEHESPLADLLLYKNRYRSLYLYLQGAHFCEVQPEITGENTTNNLTWKLLEDSSFMDVQREELKLQMGLFAYADATENWNLRYLYGPHDLPQDKMKTFPHFYIKPFYCHEIENSPGHYEFRVVDKLGFWDHSRTFYYGRTNIHYRELDFVQILQADENSPHWQRRTGYEREMDIIYASEGEMGSCTLAWLMLCVNQSHSEMLERALMEKDQKKIIKNLRDIKFNFQLKKRELTTTATLKTVEPEPLLPWIVAQREESLFYWLHKLGLIKWTHPEQNPEMTERGYRLVTWLSLYLKSLGGEELSVLGYNEPYFYRIIRGVQKLLIKDFEDDGGAEFIRKLFHSRAKEGSLSSAIYRLLPGKTSKQICSFIDSSEVRPEPTLLQSVLNVVNKILDEREGHPWEQWLKDADASNDLFRKLENIREPFCRKLLILLAHFPGCIRERGEFSPSWLDGIDSELVEHFLNAVENIKEKSGLTELLQAIHLFIKWRKMENGDEFKKRCRFNLLGHLTLRAGRQSQECIETASRAWIVFPVHYDYIDYQESSGVFSVGFFLGTFKDSTDEGYDYIDHFDRFGDELTDRIFKIRQIIDLLAKVENREIYIRDIYNIQIQEAMENQHRWTIHEIRNEISCIKGYINRFKPEDIWKNPLKIKRDNLILARNFSEYELVLHWVGEMLKGKKVENDERWVTNGDMQQAFKRYAYKLLRAMELSNFHDIKDKQGKPLFETNHFELFDPKDPRTKYYLPFYTYCKLINEFAKNIVKYADRTQKCYFMFKVDNSSLTITVKNTYAMNPTAIISTGKGLELFERFLKVYDKGSFIDRSGLISKNIGDECICQAKIAIKKGG